MRGNSATVMEIGIQGSIPAPSLYKGLDTHQHSNKNNLTTLSEGNARNKTKPETSATITTNMLPLTPHDICAWVIPLYKCPPPP